MDFKYVEQWSRGYKEPLRPMTEQRAHTLHARGKWYTVLIGPLERPSSFIEVVGENAYVGVNHLDHLLRDYLIYDFQGPTTGPLFLSMCTFRTYIGDSEKIAISENYRFTTDGNLTVTRTNLDSGVREVGSRHLDVTSNYEAWPEFGRYESLLVRERDIRHA